MAQKTKRKKKTIKKSIKISRIGIESNKKNGLHITDEDIQGIKKVVDKKEQKEVKLALDPLTIKALSLLNIVALIELREGELKQLKNELVSRLI